MVSDLRLLLAIAYLPPLNITKTKLLLRCAMQ